MSVKIKETFQCLIIGRETQTGASLVRYLTERGIGFRALDIRSPHDVSDCCKAIESAPEQYVINCLFEDGNLAILSWQDSWASVAADLVGAVAKTQKRYIQLSNASVFSGKLTRAYVETDATDSVSPTGIAYAQAEQSALLNCESAIVLRTGWVFSGEQGNFLTRLVDAAIRSESLVFSGKLMGCPTDANMIARVILAIIEQLDCDVTEPPLRGVFHYADSDVCSMHTFAKAVITAVKSLAEVRVESISEGDSMATTDTIADIENYELGCKRILSTFGIKQRPWRRGIQDVLKTKF